jgi:pyruvate dehydrogenase E2 component (dihydrolipoyllysine-residue acetyltransferase)
MSDQEGVEATPAAEAAAEELGVDLTEVEGTGQDDRILVADVQAAAGGRTHEEWEAAVAAEEQAEKDHQAAVARSRDGEGGESE